MTKIHQPSSPFWKGVYPDGMTATDIDNELADLEFLIDNVSKVYMHVTGQQASKPMIYAEVINSLHDDYCTEMYDQAAKEIINIIESITAFECVRTTWDHGQMVSIRRDIIKEIKQQLGLK